MILHVFRHDAHKFTGTPHAHAADTFAGVPVNRSVPYGADGDAAKLSRPSGAPEPTVPQQTTAARLSLLTGKPAGDQEAWTERTVKQAVRELLTGSDPEEMHAAWLTSDVAALFNESVYYPYTSLKYHTLLAVALVANYRDDASFAELRLVVDPPAEIVPYRTVYAGNRCALRIDTDGDGRPAAHLGSRPRRSWAAVWSRLPEHPLETDVHRAEMVLDANLRRICAWSTALQYFEDYTAQYSKAENESESNE